MYIPIVHERVRAEGRRGIHVVIFADYHRGVADIRLESNPRIVERGVAFEQLFAVWDNGLQETVNQTSSPRENQA
jgi:hypothetical protein